MKQECNYEEYVHYSDTPVKGWYYWDKTMLSCYGPCETKENAIKELKNYHALLIALKANQFKCP